MPIEICKKSNDMEVLCECKIAHNFKLRLSYKTTCKCGRIIAVHRGSRGDSPFEIIHDIESDHAVIVVTNFNKYYL